MSSIWTLPGQGLIVQPGGGVIVCPQCPCDGSSGSGSGSTELETVECQYGCDGEAYKYYEVLFTNLDDNNCNTCEDYDDKKFVVEYINDRYVSTLGTYVCHWEYYGKSGETGWPWPCFGSNQHSAIQFQIYKTGTVTAFRTTFGGFGLGLLDKRYFHGFEEGDQDCQFDSVTMDNTFTNTLSFCRLNYTDASVVVRPTDLTTPGIYDR